MYSSLYRHGNDLFVYGLPDRVTPGCPWKRTGGASVIVESPNGDGGIVTLLHATIGKTETSVNNFYTKEQNSMSPSMFADTSVKPKHRKRTKRTPVLHNEIRSIFLHERRINGISEYLKALGGLSCIGVFISLLVTNDEKYGIQANPVLWVGFTLVLIVCMVLLYLAVPIAVIASGTAVEYLLEGRLNRQRRRRALVTNTRILKKSVVNGLIPLMHLESVLKTLRINALSGEPAARGPVEAYLVGRWFRQRRIALQLLETSWQQALPDAMESLTRHENQYTNTSSSTISRDTTEVAWYLARHPSNIAVSRLLSEYLPVQQLTQSKDIGDSYVEFHTGVVYTPRWVYELVRRAESSGRSTAETWFPNRYSRLIKKHATIGNECVPIGDVDREMVNKLYEPYGNGPLSSLKQTVEIARSL